MLFDDAIRRVGDGLSWTTTRDQRGGRLLRHQHITTKSGPLSPPFYDTDTIVRLISLLLFYISGGEARGLPSAPKFGFSLTPFCRGNGHDNPF
jgi:hypothetical protein